MTARATTPARSLSASAARWLTPARAHDIATAGVIAVIAFAIARLPLVSGDYGQWLMVSRYFSGDSVPGYRDAWAVAPLVPALLAVFRVVLGDPVAALQVLRVLLIVGLLAAFYACGVSLFRWRAAGMLAVVFGVALTSRFLELFAFGGMLQVASLAFMLGGLAAIGQALRAESHERAWWVTAAAAMGLAVLSHAGSVVIVVPVALATALVAVAWNWPRRTPLQWATFLAPAAAVGGAALAFWVLVLVPANQGYSDNPASNAFRGPDVLFHALTSSYLTLGLLVGGALATAGGAACELARRRAGPYAITGAWLAATWGVLFATMLSGTPTDYPRFATPLLAPLVVAMGAGAAHAARWLTGALRDRAPALMPRHAAPFYLGGIVLLIGVPGQLDTVRAAATYYGVSDRVSIESFSGWIEDELPEGQSVLVLEPRAGKWVEGLTGAPALFSNKTRYSFRSDEWERSVAADAMVRSTTALVNGLVSAKYMGSAEASRGDVPRELLLGVNHDGEWLDLLRLPDASARVLSDGQSAGTLATLGKLEPVSVEREQTADAVVVRTTFRGMRAGHLVTWVRTVSIGRDSPVADVVDEVTTDAAMDGIETEVTSYVGKTVPGEVQGGILTARYPNAGNRQPVVEVRVVDGGGAVEQRDGRFFAHTTGTRMHVQLEAHTAGAPISKLQVLYPHQLMEDYHVGAAILKRDGAMEERLRRLEALGLRIVMDAGAYVLLARDYAYQPGGPSTASSAMGGAP